MSIDRLKMQIDSLHELAYLDLQLRLLKRLQVLTITFHIPSVRVSHHLLLLNRRLSSHNLIFIKVLKTILKDFTDEQSQTCELLKYKVFKESLSQRL